MKKVISLAVCCATVGSFGATELIKNGTFAAGAAPWKIFDQQTWYKGTSKTNFAVTNGEAVVAPVTLGQYEWESYFYQDGLQLVQGKTYECSFDFKLINQNDNRDYRPITLEIKADYDKVGNISYYQESNFVIYSTGKKTFRFKMVNPTDNNARISFIYGQGSKGIILDNISVVETTSDEILPVTVLYSKPWDIAFSRPTFGWNGRDDSGIKEYRYTIDGGAEMTTTANNLTLPYDLAKGDHTFTVWAISNTGEVGYSDGLAFKITGGSVPVASQALSRSAAMTVTTNSIGLQINTANNSPIELNITNVAGRVVYSSTVTPSNNVVAVSNSTMGLASGIYMLSLKDMTPNASALNMKISL